jgi:flagellar hook-basal body complex protein FliE
VAEVLTATRKAGIAFDLLMEIRNKLMDAYTEMRQMRV